MVLAETPFLLFFRFLIFLFQELWICLVVFHPPVAWSLFCSTSVCSLYSMLMWKLPEIIASYYITVAAYLMCFLMLRRTESVAPLIAVTLLQIPDCTTIISLKQLHNMILLEYCRLFFKYLYVCLFLCCSHKLRAGVCCFAQLWWKLWRSRSLQHTGITGSGVKQLQSSIHRAQTCNRDVAIKPTEVLGLGWCSSLQPSEHSLLTWQWGQVFYLKRW